MVSGASVRTLPVTTGTTRESTAVESRTGCWADAERNGNAAAVSATSATENALRENRTKTRRDGYDEAGAQASTRVKHVATRTRRMYI